MTEKAFERNYAFSVLRTGDALTTRLENIKQLANHLSRLPDGDSARRRMADDIKQEADAILRALGTTGDVTLPSRLYGETPRST